MTDAKHEAPADHAELLAKLANDMRKFEHHAVGSLRIDMDEVRKIIAACDSHAALLSEIAALRGERDGLKNRVSCLERLGGEQSTRVMEQATRAKDAERQRDELRKALEPFAALADKFGCWSVVEVCAPEPGNTSPVIQPLPLSAFETAAALIANQGADHD